MCLSECVYVGERERERERESMFVSYHTDLTMIQYSMIQYNMSACLSVFGLVSLLLSVCLSSACLRLWSIDETSVELFIGIIRLLVL